MRIRMRKHRILDALLIFEKTIILRARAQAPIPHTTATTNAVHQDPAFSLLDALVDTFYFVPVLVPGKQERRSYIAPGISPKDL